MLCITSPGLSIIPQKSIFLMPGKNIEVYLLRYKNTLPMKHFSTIFDLFLYESIFVLFFGGILHVLDDPKSDTLISVAAVSFVIAAILGITGLAFNLFKNQDPSEDF